MTSAYSLTRDDARIRSTQLSVKHIDVQLDLSLAADETSTHFPVTSSITMSSTSSSTFVDVAGLVDRVLLNETPVPFRHVGHQLFIDCLPADRQPFTLVVEARCKYSRTGEGLHRYRDPEDGRTYLYTQFEPTDTHRAWPCFDQPDIKPSWTFHVTAPYDWVVTSNGTVTETQATPAGDTVHHFSSTHPLSSYITAVIVGQYAVVDGGEWAPSEATVAAFPQVADLRIPLRVMCRQALAPFMDYDDIFTVTRQGFDYFHQKYRIAYPWGAYDQIYVPEYNLGAMENPGCVTFNERFLSRDTPTYAERQSRANVILHEMCHMWFGDLATPAWWDDLWLKESFADNQGTMAAAEATQYTTEWASFAIARKAWAYQQDLYPTTHPIVADIPDVQAAKTNFDGITYAKGAAVLKQLVAWVGKDTFFNAAHSYFARHSFGATSLQDLLDALAEHSGSDLSTWQDSWLHTTDPTVIEASVHHDGSRVVMTINQHPLGDRTTKPRPHMLKISAFALADSRLAKLGTVPVRVEDASTVADVSDACRNSDGVLLQKDQLFFVLNSEDDAYIVVFMDEHSTNIALEHISDINSPVTRAVVWSALWHAVRECRLSPQRYCEAVLRHLRAESDEAIARRLVETLTTAVNQYSPTSVRHALAKQCEVSLVKTVEQENDAERQRLWARGYLALVTAMPKLSPAAIEILKGCAEKTQEILPATAEFQWSARTALAAHGLVKEPELRQALETERTGENDVRLTRSLAALPDPDIHQQIWTQVKEAQMSNEHMSAALDGFSCSTLKNAPSPEEFFSTVEDFWNTQSIGMSIRFVRGAFPAGIDADSEQDAQKLLDLATSWIDSHPAAPQALVRLMRERTDDLYRARRVQKFARESS